MKKCISFISMLIFFGLGTSFGQGNTLVFNQVVTLSNTSVTTSPFTIATVPAGVVWKIEYMGSYRTSYPNAFSINTGGSECTYPVFTYGSQTANPTPHGPIWLKAGDVINMQLADPSYPASYFISIVEFLVIPN